MHRPTEFAKRFADRLSDRHYTDEELLPRNEADADARRVRETPPPYGGTPGVDAGVDDEGGEAAMEGEGRRAPPCASSRRALSVPSDAPARRRPR